MSDPRWTVDDGLIVCDPEPNEDGDNDCRYIITPTDVDNDVEAYDALVECVRSHDTLTRARQLAAVFQSKYPADARREFHALMDLLTGEGQ